MSFRLLPHLWLAFAACSPSSTVDLGACQSAACRSQSVLLAFDTHPTDTLAVLTGLQTVEKESLLRHLVTARPQDIELICGGLMAPDGPGWGVCSRLRERPHLLHSKITLRDPERSTRPAPGPETRHPPSPSSRLETPTDPTAPSALPEDCQPGWPCVTEVAIRQLNSTRPIPPGQACLEGFVQEEKLRHECLFRVAEALAEGKRWKAAEPVLRLCASTGSFVHGCLRHTISTLMPDIPAADTAEPKHLQESLKAIDALRDAVDPEFADLYGDFFWAIWTTQSLRLSKRIDSSLLQLLPPEARPHVHMAAAYELLRRIDPMQRTDLASLVDRLEGRLAAPRQPGRVVHHRATLWNPPDFWPDDLQEGFEQKIPAAFCMGVGRRPTSDIPHLDLELAVLEATARLPTQPPARFYLAVLNEHPEDLVRWTALRLLGALYPEELSHLELEDEPVLLRMRVPFPVIHK